MPKVLKVKDKSDKQVIDMGILPDVRFFGLIVGKTGSGKGVITTNMLLNPEFGYLNIFKGENIYIFSGSLTSDQKLAHLINLKEIDESNLYNNYDNDAMNELYDKLEEEYNDRQQNDMPMEYPLIVIDDLSFAMGRGKDFSALYRLAQNSRKLGISVLLTTQHYTQIPLAIRNNISFAVLFNTSVRNIEQIEQEHNYLPTKKMFMEMFREYVKTKRDFIVVNYSNNGLQIYLDKDFNLIFDK